MKFGSISNRGAQAKTLIPILFMAGLGYVFLNYDKELREQASLPEANAQAAASSPSTSLPSSGAATSLAPAGGTTTSLPSPVPAASIPPIKAGEPLPANLFVELAKAINPAVVNIATSETPRPRPGLPQGNKDPMFEFFEQFLGPNFQMPQRPVQSLGTGFIIREDGLIVTNNHVVDRADVIKVYLTEDSKESFEAKVIGKDERTDIALIKIRAKTKLAVARLGDSDTLQVGEWVAAFGNPFGHGHTMTKGIVSAIGREITELNRFPFIQTDASINPGNSGGPLVNMQGLVIGVNSAIDARAQGIGFAIPIAKVKSILPELEKTGRIKRGFIGVGLDEPLTEESARALGLKEPSGAIVAAVEEGTPAKKAGIEPYDVIVRFGNRTIDTPASLLSAVENTPIGTRVPVGIVRKGKSLSLSVTVAERPSDDDLSPSPSKSERGNQLDQLGFRVQTYSPSLAERLELPKINQRKQVVVQVRRDSPAEQSDLRTGDIILDVNQRPVSSEAELKDALAPNRVNALRVLRGLRVRFVYLKF